MIARIPRRLSFTRFQGVRACRNGVLAVRMVPDAEVAHVHVAFATPRRLGSAVVRNRVRRQLRELMRARAAHLPTGWYLIGVHATPVDINWGQLGAMLDAALHQAQQPHTTHKVAL